MGTNAANSPANQIYYHGLPYVPILANLVWETLILFWITLLDHTGRVRGEKASLSGQD